MNGIKRILKKALQYMVEASFIRHVREELEELIGRFGRFILARMTKVQPNKIFFHTQEDRYCCNPKYICEEFRRRGCDVDMVWRVKKGQRGGIPHDVRVVVGGSYNHFKELFSSKYVITNSVLYVKRGFRLKKEQVVFSTWHGSLGIKRFGKKEYKGGWHWVRGAIATGKMSSYCVTNSTTVSNAMRETYWPKTPMLEYGHPRNDIMFDNYAERRKEVRDRFLARHELPEDVHFIMYGPTFRDSHNFKVYEIDPEGLIEAARERFGGEWVLLLRYHSALRSVFKAKNKIKNNIEGIRIINVTNYSDMQELITIADIAITDYSSWIYDFMLQRKPGFIFAMDIDKYNNERGFCFPLETTPFPIAITKEELNEKVRNFNEEEYLERLEAFLAEKGCIEDGHASERVVDKILELMEQDKNRKGRK